MNARVISGTYKGRLLKLPELEEVRPTKDRVKESLFEIVKPYLVDADVLDLFSGSGALGIEALSRGAKSCTFVEREPVCLKTIEGNLDALGIDVSVATIMRADAFKAIRQFVEKGEKFGIVIADPPYGMDHIRKLLIKLGTYDIFKKPHILVLEHFIKEDIPQKEGHLILQKQYKYGDSVLSILKKEL
jgi:16S rRNA (guanine(966)-N(2))-methyltransferase RsmD